MINLFNSAITANWITGGEDTQYVVEVTDKENLS